jgi:quercetin dioxygenase-like cupin family protein
MSESISEFIYKGMHSQALLFKMKSGDYLKAHRATVDVLIIVAQGNVEITANEQTTALQQGDYIVLEANTRHAVSAKTDLQFYLVKLAPHG